MVLSTERQLSDVVVAICVVSLKAQHSTALEITKNEGSSMLAEDTETYGAKEMCSRRETAALGLSADLGGALLWKYPDNDIFCL